MSSGWMVLIPTVFFGVILATILRSVVKYGTWKGAMFGAKVDRMVGVVEAFS